MVDDCGIVYSKKGRPLKPSVNPKGYKIVNLSINGNQVGKAVHTLVARAFVDGYAEGLQVNHKDGNKLNNNADNLEWVTPKENTRHAIEELGFDISGSNNHNAKRVFGYDKNTNELLYEFDCVINAGRYFACGNEKRARHIQNIISQIANGNNRRKSYHGCIWKY